MLERFFCNAFVIFFIMSYYFIIAMCVKDYLFNILPKKRSILAELIYLMLVFGFALMVYLLIK